MKKIIVLVLAVCMVLGMAGCGKADDQGSQDTVKAKETGKVEWVEKDGLLTHLDLENSPFPGTGLNISIDSKNQVVNVIKTDQSGKDTVEYWKFNYKDNQMEKYIYVSMMGTGFYYYYDLEKGEVVRIESDTHEDKTQSTKDSGRYEKSNNDTREEVAQLEAYFMEQYGKTIKDLTQK